MISAKHQLTQTILVKSNDYLLFCLGQKFKNPNFTGLERNREIELERKKGRERIAERERRGRVSEQGKRERERERERGGGGGGGRERERERERRVYAATLATQLWMNLLPLVKMSTSVL